MSYWSKMLSYDMALVVNVSICLSLSDALVSTTTSLVRKMLSRKPSHRQRSTS